MIELVKFIVETFAVEKDAILYDIQENGKDVDITVFLKKSDMGRVIGRQGKLAKALRTLVRLGSVKENKKYNVEIKELGE